MNRTDGREFEDEALDRLRKLLSRRPAGVIDNAHSRRAAVLVPLVLSSDGWSILFTKRADTLQFHKGQVSFPGGSAEPRELLEQAALREAEEEAGIPRREVDLIGRLDDVVTTTGFLVAPFVGVIPSGIRYVLQTSEVADLIEVPVSKLMDYRTLEIRHVDYQGGRYPSYFFVVDGTEIWGLTGRIVKMFLDLVKRSL